MKGEKKLDRPFHLRAEGPSPHNLKRIFFPFWVLLSEMGLRAGMSKIFFVLARLFGWRGNFRDRKRKKYKLESGFTTGKNSFLSGLSSCAGFRFLDDRALTSAKGIQEWCGARKASLGRFPRTEERKVDRTGGDAEK